MTTYKASHCQLCSQILHKNVQFVTLYPCQCCFHHKPSSTIDDDECPGIFEILCHAVAKSSRWKCPSKDCGHTISSYDYYSMAKQQRVTVTLNDANCNTTSSSSSTQEQPTAAAGTTNTTNPEMMSTFLAIKGEEMYQNCVVSLTYRKREVENPNTVNAIIGTQSSYTAHDVIL